jgi:O-antigen/teichoic acid export membrane protein
MLAGALAILPLGVVAIPLLFGREYEGAVGSFLVLTPGMAALALSRVLSRYFAAVHRQRALLVLRAASLAANVLLNLVLIPRHGIVGAALASLLSYGVEALGIAWLFLADSKRSAREVFLPRAADLRPLLERMRR